MAQPSSHGLPHGAIGNGRLLALIAPSTAVEWMCVPRFDGPSVFAALLDPAKGGSFALEPVGEPASARMEYVRNTNILRTRVTTPDGAYEVLDFAPSYRGAHGFHAPLELHRLVRKLEGTPRLRVRFDPRPDYGRAAPEIADMGSGLEIGGGPTKLFLRSDVPTPYLQNGMPIRIDRTRWFVLSAAVPSESRTLEAVERDLELTTAWWRAWAMSCALPQFAAEHVLRSALCLKLHAYRDTGAIIAAATTSIPEALGTERTWDYRYCWLRDSAFVVEALRRLSHLAEGEAFVRFLRDVAESGPLQPLYGIGGERVLKEEHLGHLSGYLGNGPVRIGNDAYRQNQHDVWGEMILCLESVLTDPRIVIDDREPYLALVERLVEEAIAAEPKLDTGPWEFRTLPRHYTFSKVMCWVAAHRGARLARLHGRASLADRWDAWAADRQAVILRESYNEKLGYFTQAFRGENPDASNLLLPTLGIVEPKDPRFVSTVRAHERLLLDGGMMLRYRHPDDFGETTSAFLICSFWWAEALAMMGELERAIEVFDSVVRHANPIGLFSEDLEPKSGTLLGNFPQAYTHVGLIHAAITIGELLEARDARFRAWT